MQTLDKTGLRPTATPTGQPAAPPDLPVLGSLRLRLATAHTRAPALVWTATGCFVLYFGHLSIARYRRFSYPSFDLAIFDQGLWLLSRFREPFITLRGLDLFGDHSSYIMVVIAPLYWVWADARLLLAVTVLALAVGAPMLYFAARALGVRPGLSAAVAIAYLSYPAVQWNAWDNFHPELLVLPLMLGSFLLIVRHHEWWAVAPIVLALMAKEDVGLVVVPFGLWVAYRARARWQGLTMAGLGVGAFLLNFLLLLPHFSPTGGAIYAGRYREYGDTALAIVWGAATNPVSVVRDLWRREHLDYLEHLLLALPTALFAPFVLILGAPVTIANFLSRHTYQANYHYHYTVYLAAAVSMAAVVGARWLQNRLGSGGYRPLVGGVLACAILYAGSGPAPGSDWGSSARPHPDVVHALFLIGDDDSVAAGPFLTSHLAHRTAIYEFPNPFARRNYSSLSIGYAPRSSSVEWVVVEPGRISFDDLAGSVVQRLLESGEWEAVLDTNAVLLLRGKTRTENRLD